MAASSAATQPVASARRDGPEVVVLRKAAMAVVSGWLDPRAMAEEERRAEVAPEMPARRPARLGLGATLVPRSTNGAKPVSPAERARLLDKRASSSNPSRGPLHSLRHPHREAGSAPAPRVGQAARSPLQDGAGGGDEDQVEADARFGVSQRSDPGRRSFQELRKEWVESGSHLRDEAARKRARVHSSRQDDKAS